MAQICNDIMKDSQDFIRAFGETGLPAGADKHGINQALRDSTNQHSSTSQRFDTHLFVENTRHYVQA